jgi:S-phase kinase-associated protein 1
MSDDEIVTLSSHDGQDYKLEVKAAKMSKTVAGLIEDAGIDHPIPLPNISGKILAKVVEFCKYHNERPEPVAEEEKRTDTIGPWDLEFFKVDQQTLFELILAANYLDIKSLLDLGCKTVANMIKAREQCLDIDSDTFCRAKLLSKSGRPLTLPPTSVPKKKASFARKTSGLINKRC